MNSNRQRIRYILLCTIFVLILASCANEPVNIQPSNNISTTPSDDSIMSDETPFPQHDLNKYDVIAEVTGDIYGDGNPRTIRLVAAEAVSLDVVTHSEVYRKISVVISGSGQDESFALSANNIDYANPEITLLDVTKDGVADVFIKLPAAGSTHSFASCFVYSFNSGALTDVLNMDNLVSELTYAITYKDYYGVEIFSTAFNKTFSTEFNDLCRLDPDRYTVFDGDPATAAYYDEGPLHVPREPEEAPVTDVIVLSDADSISLKQDIWSGTTKNDTVGSVISLLTWDDTAMRFIVAEQTFEPWYYSNIGQSVTMRYVCQTDIVWPNDYHFYYPFVHGFSSISTNKGFQFIDKYGQLIEKGYGASQPFNANGTPKSDDPYKMYAGEGMYFYSMGDGAGYALTNADGSFDTGILYHNSGDFYNGLSLVYLIAEPKQWVLIDTTGTVKATLPEDIYAARWSGDPGVVICRYGAYKSPGMYEQLYDSNGKPLSDERFDWIGHFYQGLAMIFKDGKVGLIDNRGNIVVEPAFPYDTQSDVNDYMNEDLMMISSNGKIAILEVIRG